MSGLGTGDRQLAWVTFGMSNTLVLDMPKGVGIDTHCPHPYCDYGTINSYIFIICPTDSLT